MQRFVPLQSIVEFFLLVNFSFTCPAAVPPTQPSPLAAQLVGTWKLKSYNYVGLPQTLAPGKVCLKTITPTHYSWTYYNATSKELISSGGGSYVLATNTCTETVDYVQGVGADFRSSAQKTCYTTPAQLEELYRAEKYLKVELVGDRLKITANLVNGNQVEETWQRVNE